jgi:hypothetical protein
VPGLRYGLADLDAYGVWIQSSDFGAVWKPKTPAGWTPFRNGKWLWYEDLGYTWISDDPWGWLTYHYGRWMLQEGAGWIWAPGQSAVFKPGEVYWLKSARLVGWGPLASAENWTPPAVPRQYLNANTTYANYAPGSLEIDPAGFTTRPQEPLATAVFAQALLSPPFPAARLDAFRPPLRAGSTRAVPVLTDAAFEAPADAEARARAEAPPRSPLNDAAYSNQPAAAPVVPVVIVDAPPEEIPVEVDVPVPVYTGIIVVNPPGYHAPASKSPLKSASPPSSGANGGSNTPPPHEPHNPKLPKVPDPDKPVK